MTYRPLYIILLILGIVPFVIPILWGIYSMFDGFTFIFNTSYGIEALLAAPMFYSVIFWPTYLIGLPLIVFSSVKLHQLRKLRQDLQSQSQPQPRNLVAGIVALVLSIFIAILIYLMIDAL